MILPLQKFSVLLESMAAGVQGSATQLVDLSVGSILRALLEACAATALWMQWLILQVLTLTRAGTSTGTDLDSWMADFNLIRLPGAASVGYVTFSRYAPGRGATILVGTTVSTTDGTQSFQVVQESSNLAWNGISGYTVAPSIAGVTVPAKAMTPGAAGNVQAGAIGLLTSPIPGIDTVLNTDVFAGGVNAESDAALRARFQLYINSRSLATPLAVNAAIASLQQGLRYTVLENQDTTGSALPGHFWVVVDDGTGAPPDSLLADASSAVEAVRPIGATYAVTGPLVVQVSVEMSFHSSNPTTQPAVASAIQAAVGSWIASLPIAGTLAVSKLEALAHGADPSVVSVTSATINGAATDVVAPENGVLLASSIVVN